LKRLFFQDFELLDRRFLKIDFPIKRKQAFFVHSIKIYKIGLEELDRTFILIVSKYKLKET